MTIEYKAGTSKEGAAAATTVLDAINAVGANFLAVFTSAYLNAAAVADNLGNVYTGLTERVRAGNVRRARLWYCANPTVSGSLVLTATGTGQFTSAAIMAFSGVKLASPFDQEAGVTGSANGSTFPQAITASQDGCLYIAGICVSSPPTGLAIDLGYTGFAIKGNTGMGLGMHYLIQTTAAIRNPQYTWSGGIDDVATLQSTFLPEPASTGPADRSASAFGLGLGIGF